MDVDALLAAIRPAVERNARSLHRRVPASVALDDLVQAGMVRAWEAMGRWEGPMAVEKWAGIQARNAMFDELRSQTPGGRNSPGYKFSDVDEAHDLSAPDDPAGDIERAQQFDARVKQIPVKHRAMAKRILAGDAVKAIAADMGVSESRVSQKLAETVAHLETVKPRTPHSFDPDAVPIRMGSMPACALRVNKSRKLIERMPATGSVVIDRAAAESLSREFKRAGIDYMVDSKKYPGMVEVWREPSLEQRAARKARAA